MLVFVLVFVIVQERCVWGIDCYTRSSVEYVLELTLGLTREQARVWITKTLLPALNRQNGPRGVDMLPALRDLCKVRAMQLMQLLLSYRTNRVTVSISMYVCFS